MSTSKRVTGLLGHPAVERSILRVSGAWLRVIAYHDIADIDAFRLHLEHLAARYRPVSGGQVARALESGQHLPPRAVWITFDDGLPSVFELGLPALNDLGLRATAYVNPGLIEHNEPHWWDIVRQANQHQLSVRIDGVAVIPARAEAALKRCPDDLRRKTISDLRDRLGEMHGQEPAGHQTTLKDLQRWLADGHEIGNHTWDHPCLDKCDPNEQRRQISEAHHWLEAQLDTDIASFAYPNGNWSQPSEDELRRLGYRTAVGFDHRFCRRRPVALRLSRLRLDTGAPLARIRAVLSGLHPALLALRTALRSDSRNDPRRLPP